MTENEMNEINKVKLSKAYIEAGADWVIYGIKDLKKIIDNIELYKISQN